MKNRLALLCAVLCAGSASAQELIGPRFDQGTPAVKGILERLNARGAGVQSAAFSYANALPDAAPAPGQDPAPAPAPESYIDRFHAVEADLLQWDQRYRDAPSGSDAEGEAKRWFDQAVEEGQKLSADKKWLAAYPSASIEDFAKECEQKYQSAAAGGAPETFYRSFIATGWDAYTMSATRELSALGHWRKVTAAADYYNDRYQAAAAGSSAETAYRTLRDAAWEEAPKVLERQLNAAWGSFRAFEKMADEFESGYQTAAAGSKQESFYDQARKLAYDAALREARRAIAADPRPEVLQPLADEYNGRQQNAAAGSPAEAYYGKVQDAIRQYLQP